MELNVLISHEQVEKLLGDPDTELVIYYPNGTKVIVRISDEQLEENLTVH